MNMDPAQHEATRLKSLAIPAVLIVLLMAVCLTTAGTLEGDARQAFLGEGGPIETTSAFCYIAITVLLCTFSFWRYDRCFAIETGALSALLAARELDFHNRFTTEGVFRSSFYFRDLASVPEKIVVSIILLGIAVLVIDYARRFTGRYIRGLLTLTPWVVTVVGGFGLIVLGKGMDSSTWAFEAVGVEQQLSISMINMLEESLELSGAVALLCAAILYVRSASRERSPRAKPLSS